MINDTLMGNLTVGTRDGEGRGVFPIVVIAILFIATIILALVGNVAVILAVMQTQRLREEKANMFIVNLACTDLGMGGVVVTSSLVSLIQNEWTMGHVWCNIVCAANYCLIIVSMLTLCLISIERFISIRKALDYHNIVTRRRIRYTIVYSWLQGIIFAVAPIIEDWIDYDYWEIVCAINWKHEHAVYYVIVAFIVCFLSPGVILVICYSQILGKASKLRVQPSAGASNTPQDMRIKKQTEFANRAIRSLLIVMVAFFICMTPFSLTKLLKVIYPFDNIVPPYVNVMATVIGYFSCGSNPLIYGIFRKDFRTAFKITLRRLFCPYKSLPADTITEMT